MSERQALPMDREEAFALLGHHTPTPSLIKHALAVEAAMRYFARHYGEDIEYWGMVGLLHDLDYDAHPDRHCQVTPEMLRESGFGEDFIRSVLSHGFGLCTDVEPEHIMERVLYATDELTGFITACVLVRPSKSVMDLEVKSVKKKFKDKAFAAAVDREVIQDGARRMDMPLDELINHVILALREAAPQLGLDGSGA
jgi:putative nucleotidyltransferase with HDIG domain